MRFWSSPSARLMLRLSLAAIGAEQRVASADELRVGTRGLAVGPSARLGGRTSGGIDSVGLRLRPAVVARAHPARSREPDRPIGRRARRPAVAAPRVARDPARMPAKSSSTEGAPPDASGSARRVDPSTPARADRHRRCTAAPSVVASALAASSAALVPVQAEVVADGQGGGPGLVVGPVELPRIVSTRSRTPCTEAAISSHAARSCSIWMPSARRRAARSARTRRRAS